MLVAASAFSVSAGQAELVEFAACGQSAFIQRGLDERTCDRNPCYTGGSHAGNLQCAACGLRMRQRVRSPLATASLLLSG